MSLYFFALEGLGAQLQHQGLREEAESERGWKSSHERQRQRQLSISWIGG